MTLPPHIRAKLDALKAKAGMCQWAINATAAIFEEVAERNKDEWAAVVARDARITALLAENDRLRKQLEER